MAIREVNLIEIIMLSVLCSQTHKIQIMRIIFNKKGYYETIEAFKKGLTKLPVREDLFEPQQPLKQPYSRYGVPTQLVSKYAQVSQHPSTLARQSHHQS